MDFCEIEELYNGEDLSVATFYEINGYEFSVGCFACPEQYDVFDCDGNLVAYIRLRYGKLKCYVPDVGGELIYQKQFDHPLLGIFPDEQERVNSLTTIANVIKEYYSRKEINGNIL